MADSWYCRDVEVKLKVQMYDKDLTLCIYLSCMMQEAILRGNNTMGLVLQISNHNLCRDQPELSTYVYMLTT